MMSDGRRIAGAINRLADAVLMIAAIAVIEFVVVCAFVWWLISTKPWLGGR